jgi:hypothetical protein
MDGSDSQPASCWASSTVGFDFTRHMRRLCADLTTRLPDLAHIDMQRVAVRYCQVRRGGRHGVQATLTPLRFERGARETTRRGKNWIVEPIYDDAGREMLYLLSFYLPRFLNHSVAEKLATVCHELWHISPEFDGDLRRHEGRCYAHGPSERQFHEAMHRLAEKWLSVSPPAEMHAFLNHDFRELQQLHGRVFGIKIPTPRLVLARDSDRRSAG